MSKYTPTPATGTHLATGSQNGEAPRDECSHPGTESITNRHGDEIRIGQLWTDDPRRTTVRTLRIDELVDGGNLGPRAVCTVIRSCDTETEQVTEPGRVVSIKVDSLHTTLSGRGYRLAVAVARPQL